jgi:DNA-binding beta-propeller fold protein YncE
MAPSAFPIVGIGASAGGIDAFRQFFHRMPADCGMAFVAGILAAVALVACVALHAEEAPPTQVLFVCEHGNVKSLMAASYFNQLAAKRGLNLRAISRGSAPDSTTVPAPIVAGLRTDGVDVGSFKPIAVSATDVAGSERVVAINTELPSGIDAPAAKIEHWDDVPAASVNYAAARDSLRAHVEQLLDRMSQESAPLSLEARIPLGKVDGRIDHLALDLDRRLLFVAELGNGSVGVVNIGSREVVRRLTGFDEPQGVAYEKTTDTLYVASGGDGSVRMFRGPQLAPAGTIKLGADADNIRLDAELRRAYVGYGDGALAVIDIATQKKIADIALPAHPESFQLERAGPRIFVNVPDAHAIAVVDRQTNRQIATWQTDDLRANYPMSLDPTGNRVLVGFRHPAHLAAFDAKDGSILSKTASCGDVDDVFVDPKRGYIYMSCGEGFIDVFEPQDRGYRRVARVETAKGARTALFSTDFDRLFLAVRASAQGPAAVWVFKPQ